MNFYSDVNNVSPEKSTKTKNETTPCWKETRRL